MIPLARASMRSKPRSADIKDSIHNPPPPLPLDIRPLKCSDTFGALVVVDIVPFLGNQLHGIPSHRDIILFF